jgi:hypothetical protein
MISLEKILLSEKQTSSLIFFIQAISSFYDDLQQIGISSNFLVSMPEEHVSMLQGVNISLKNGL